MRKGPMLKMPGQKSKELSKFSCKKSNFIFIFVSQTISPSLPRLVPGPGDELSHHPAPGLAQAGME